MHTVPTDTRAHALDGLRGFAAAAVVIYHAILHNDLALIDRVLYRPIFGMNDSSDVWAKLVLTIQHGETAVFLFFILSGAVLRMSLERRNAGPLATVWTFTRNRVLRLYPPLIACVLLMFVAGKAGVPGFPNWDTQALLHNVTLYATPIHGASDTLQAEMLAVPFILLAWLLRRVFGLPGLVLALVYGIQALGFMPLAFGLPAMHVYLMAFFAGMLAAEPAARPLMQQVPAAGWWLALALLVFGRLLHWHGSHTALITMVLAGALLVSGMLHGRPNSLSRILEGRFAQQLGKVSFSLYLFNVPVQFLIWGVFANQWQWAKAYPVTAGLVIGVASLLLTWPLAALSERWIERPFASFGKRRAPAQAVPERCAPAA